MLSTLTRVRIVFNIADLNTFDQDADSFSEDPALYDEQLAEDGAINQGGAGNPNFKVTPEDSASAADKAEAGEENLDDDLPGFPARVNITIEKEGIPSAIHIDATAKDGEIMIDNVYHFPKAEIVNAKTAEQEYKAKDLYTGPPFGNLDEGLQLLLDEYLAERGIDSGLAQFIPDYIDHKEQREYVNWLEGNCNPLRAA